MLCGLAQLDVVDLSGNQITCVPDGIESLQAVEVNLNMNQVSEIYQVAGFSQLGIVVLSLYCVLLIWNLSIFSVWLEFEKLHFPSSTGNLGKCCGVQ